MALFGRGQITGRGKARIPSSCFKRMLQEPWVGIGWQQSGTRGHKWDMTHASDSLHFSRHVGRESGGLSNELRGGDGGRGESGGLVLVQRHRWKHALSPRLSTASSFALFLLQLLVSFWSASSSYGACLHAALSLLEELMQGEAFGRASKQRKEDDGHSIRPTSVWEEASVRRRRRRRRRRTGVVFRSVIGQVWCLDL